MSAGAGSGELRSALVDPGDLVALRLDADLVVLSGCRTAGSVLVDLPDSSCRI
jgi:CHAT domain-containing protein